jgi:hypothetical protein
MATKKKPIEMTNMQMLNRLVRMNAPTRLVVNTARTLVDHQMEIDAENGPTNPITNETVQVIWALATALDRLNTENETLQRKLRRDNRRTAKPKTEMLKKTPEQAGAQSVSFGAQVS